MVIVGGIIPREDIPVLKSQGVDGVFPVHSTLEGDREFYPGAGRQKERGEASGRKDGEMTSPLSGVRYWIYPKCWPGPSGP